MMPDEDAGGKTGTGSASDPPGQRAAATGRAHAKINLTLEIMGRRPDGYHRLKSLVAFADDIADKVRFMPGEVADTALSGPMSAQVDGRNIIDVVLADLAAHDPELLLGRFEIEKHIPVAAGLGGGSADAAAALRLIAEANGIADVEANFANRAVKWGADIPVCIGAAGARAAMMAGIGEIVRRPKDRMLLPPEVFAVLVNPGVPVSTADVFRLLEATALDDRGVVPPEPQPLGSFDSLIDYMERAPNDLEAPALSLAPAIGEVLAVLGGQSGCRIARMSGSGATCFGMFQTRAVADRAARAITSMQPGWWVRTTAVV